MTEKIVTFLNSCTQDTDLSSTDTDSLNSSVGSVSEDGSQIVNILILNPMSNSLNEIRS